MDIDNITIEQTERLLSSYILSPITQQLHDYFSEPSFLEILHVDRKEYYHSHFLKWLFEDAELFPISIPCLLFLLQKRARKQKSHFPIWLNRAILTNTFNVDYVKIKVEDQVESNKAKGRCDLLMKISYHLPKSESKIFYLFLENKVYSYEHKVGKSGKMQTTFYYDFYSNKFGEDNCAFVYLDLTNTLELEGLNKPGCACEKFIHINYQDMLDNILIVLTKKQSIQERKQFILKEYIKGLSINYSQNKSIMALESSLRDLLLEFWDNNHDLIKLSIEALLSDPELNEEQRKRVKNVKKDINALDNQRDKTHYLFDGKQYNGKRALVVAILSFLLKHMNLSDVNNAWKEYLEKQQGKIIDFDSSKDWTINQHNDITDNTIKSELKKLKSHTPILSDVNIPPIGVEQNTFEHNYSEIANQKCSFYNQWGWLNIDYMIKFYRELNKNKQLGGTEIKIIM